MSEIKPIKLQVNYDTESGRRITWIKILAAITGNPLTDNEITVAESFIRISEGLITEQSRIMVCEDLNLKMTNLNQTLMRIRKKGYLQTENVPDRKDPDEVERFHRNFNLFLDRPIQINLGIKS